MLATNPAKARVERWWLVYTPLWGGVTGVVMLGGFAERWGDLECLVFGLVLALGAWLPALRPHESERALPVHQRVSVKLSLAVTLFAFGLNYVQTPFFFDVLHMHYGFDVRWVIDRNPVFLYLVTVAYFATYCALLGVTFRFVGRWSRPLSYVLAPVIIAASETALNANGLMNRLFCYDDMPFMLWFGTLVYAFSFVCVLPVFMRVDEREDTRLPAGRLVVFLAAALFFDHLFLEVTRHLVAPHLTTVVDDAPGLRDYGAGCLERPRDG